MYLLHNEDTIIYKPPDCGVLMQVLAKNQQVLLYEHKQGEVSGPKISKT